jgi:hypothetical protein
MKKLLKLLAHVQKVPSIYYYKLTKKASRDAIPLKVVTNEKGGAVGDVLTIIC